MACSEHGGHDGQHSYNTVHLVLKLLVLEGLLLLALAPLSKLALHLIQLQGTTVGEGGRVGERGRTWVGGVGMLSMLGTMGRVVHLL